MTSPAPRSTSPSTARRAGAVLASLAVLGLGMLALAGSASATASVGWPDAGAVSVWRVVIILIVIPVAMFLVITAFLYVPPAVRGEKLLPGTATTVSDQWLGGPRKAAGELAGPDTEESKAGGAGGSW